MRDFLEVAQTLQMAIKSLLMYTAAHPRAKAALMSLTGLIEGWLEDSPTLHIATSSGRMFLDGVPYDGQSIHLASMVKVLSDRQISGIIFSRGVTPEEVQEVLELLILKPARIEERGGAAKILSDLGLQHVRLGQTQYREVREGDSGVQDDRGPAMKPLTLPMAEESSAEPAPNLLPSLDALQALVDQWRSEFKKLADETPSEAKASHQREFWGTEGPGGPGSSAGEREFWGTEGPGGQDGLPTGTGEREFWGTEGSGGQRVDDDGFWGLEGPGGEGPGEGERQFRGPAGPGGPAPAEGEGEFWGTEGPGGGASGDQDPEGAGPGSAGGPERSGAKAPLAEPDPALAEGLGSGPANLSYLGKSLASLGLGEGFPSAQQMEGIRKALMELPPGVLLSVVEGLDTLPQSPGGLRMAFQALAPEIFAQATTKLLAGGWDQGHRWAALKDQLHGLLHQTPSFQGLLAALEDELRRKGMGLGNLHELVARLDWDTMGADEQLRLVMDRDQLWKLSHEQRLAFLRKLLDEGRFDAFTTVLAQVLQAMEGNDSARREVAARTLAGVSRWVGVPGLPRECELDLAQSLVRHFAVESFPQIHHAVTLGLGATLTGLVTRGEPGVAMDLLREVEGLCSFQEPRGPWRADALVWLKDRLAEPEALEKVLELLHTANPETLLIELIPYLEAVGTPAAQKLVEVLGEEQDRKRRGRLVEVIRSLGGLALPSIFEALASEKWYLVRNTLNLLADMGDVEALKPVEACLEHMDGRVRRAAVRAVWKLGGDQAVPSLLKAFGAADQDTMLEIMFAFGQIRSKQAVPLLGQFASERRMPEKLRARAAETLGLIGDPSALPFLEELLKRKGRIFTTAEPTELRLAAGRGLISLGSAPALTTLRYLVSREPRNNDRPLLQALLDQHP